MRSGWYIINYHDVDYEDSILTRALGATTRPDVFAEHLEQMSALGRLVSVDEGRSLLEQDRIREPLFSVWFDDGFAGVCDNALALCERYGAPAAISVCSRFVRRQQMFWRAELSYLAHCDGLRLLRSRLRKIYPEVPMRLRRWTLDAFSQQMVDVIDALYLELAHEAFRRDAFRVFADEARLERLVRAGWRIANHSAAHYPMLEGLDRDAALSQFEEGRELVEQLAGSDDYWVLPFGTGAPEHLEHLAAHATLVEVADKPNTAKSWRRTGRLFRFRAPETRDFARCLAV